MWLYHRFNLSQRDIENLLAERGIMVSYESFRLWCNKFEPIYTLRLKRRHQGFGDTFYLDEVFVKTSPSWHSRGGCRSEQDYTGHCFSVIISNSPSTGVWIACCLADSRRSFTLRPNKNCHHSKDRKWPLAVRRDPLDRGHYRTCIIIS